MICTRLVGLTAVLATGYWLVSDGAITVGGATAAALYFHRAFDPVGELLFLFDDLQDALSSLGRLVGIADLPVPEDAPARAGTTVVARGLGHSYLTGHAVLDDVDLDIAPGEHVAVVGTSGAGGTTLARIVAGVLEPTPGDVRIGEGHPHASAALVAQEVHVFAGTLGDDLRLADRTALVVAHRLTQARAADRILVMEHGRVVESGTHDELLAAGGRYAVLWSAWERPRRDVR